MDGRKYDEHLYIVEVDKYMQCSEFYIPLLSVIGSSNLSERSTNRDFELSMCIVTTDPSVRAQLHLEQARLREHARDATQAGAGVSGEGPLAAAVARAVARALRTLF